MNKGTWFIFVLYKPAEDNKHVQAKLVQFWSSNVSKAVKRIETEYPDYQQWFLIQTGWWKALWSVLSFSKIVRWK